jgi:hypothetical protein
VAIQFRKATKEQLKLRMALIGPAGSGKTYSALNIARHLGKRIAVIDTEHGSASKYAGLFEFDVVELDSFHPQNYIAGIQAAQQAGYDVLIIDSLSHAWMGKDGALELVDRAAKRSPSGNSFAAWRDVTPLHNQLIEAMLGARLHLIVTMRSKMEYVQDKDEKGRTQIRKVGLQPVQRDGLEYEFDVVADLDTENTFIVGKTRCPQLTGVIVPRPGKEVADTLLAWLTDGAPPAELPKAPTPQPATQPTAQAVPAARSTPRPAAPQPSGNPGELVLPFGKYQGQTLADVWGKDAGYVKWLATNSTNAEVKAAAQTIAQAQPKATLPPETAANYAQTLVTEAQLKRLYAIANEHQVPAALVKEYMRDTHKVSSAKELNRAQYDAVCAWLEAQGKAAAQLEDIDIGDGIPTDDNWAAGLEPPPEETFGDAHGQFAFGGDAV